MYPPDTATLFAAAPADPENAIPAADLAAVLDTAVRGRVATPADQDWDEVRAAWNLTVDQRPDVVVQVDDAADIAAVVRIAGTYGLRVAPQGTGHNAAPLGDLAGTILLRTDRLREVSVEPATRIVRIEAGVLWGEVTRALAPHGLAALAGSSADVGVIGYTLGGGYSWLARRHGLAASAVTAVELVTGDGRWHRVDATHEPELFWAVRGGGANIGIVCALEFQVVSLPFAYAGNLMFPMARAAEVLRAYESWTRELDPAATTCVRLLRMPPLPDLPEFLRGRSFVVVDGAIEAPIGEATRLLQPLRDLGPEIDTFAVMPTADFAALHMDPPHPVPGVGDGLILEDLTDEAIEALLAVAGPDVPSALLAVDLRHLGGELARPALGGGAVDHLPGRFLVFAVGVAISPEVGRHIGRDLAAVREALAPWTSGRDYQNFREAPVTADRIHPAETLARLVAVRRQHDPQQVLRANHPLG